MDCKESQILFAPHIMGDLEHGPGLYSQLEAHLLSCQACRERYEIREQTIAFIEQHKAIFAEALRNPEEKKAAEKEEIELSWKRIEARLDELEVQERKEKQAKFRRLIVRVSSVAACLVVGISTFLTYSIYSKPKVALKPSIRIELVSDNGNILIPADRPIVSSDELKTLIIDGKHRMVMNTNTVLAVESLRENSNTGCLVKLDSGRIYTHVEHEGNPFVVDTVHGKAVITGTTFDVKVTHNSTTLIVSEGTVQFESEKGVVKVAAGQTSEIAGQSAPSIPLSCNTAELTAWATGYKSEPALAQAESNTYPLELTLSPGKEPVILEETDYTTWVEQKRGWFKQNFPWIFQLKDALAKEGIKVDYPELLIKSGDIWQFVYLDVSPARFSVIDPNSLINTASDYGFGEQDLFEAVPSAKFAIGDMNTKTRLFGLDAFSKWVTFLEDIRNSSKELDWDTLLYSLHASTYLTNTKTLGWLSIKNSTFTCDVKDRRELLLLLQEEVQAACNCVEALKLAATSQHKSCSPEYWEVLDHILKNTKVIYESEKAIHELRQSRP
ncbi:MAG: FecR family protein [Phycisphaerae bacterium]|nr:FecR family protein [Phycisphaerae bacterium]